MLIFFKKFLKNGMDGIDEEYFHGSTPSSLERVGVGQIMMMLSVMSTAFCLLSIGL